MPICPHCQTPIEEELTPCPTGDGYYAVSQKDFASFRGDALLGRAISGRYIIHSVIGRGAIGRVYKGRQLGVERDVVLKLFRLDHVIEEELGYNPSKTVVEARHDARERFVREARVLGQLTHPNCVTLYDFGISEDEALLYIAMEYVAGRSLRGALQRGLKPGATLDVMRQILAAVRQAHSLDIVHRDLKPENIMLSFRKESGEPYIKVLDFGIAKLVGKDKHDVMAIDGAKTTMGMLFGTPAYMSPEQCRGAADEIGLPSDVYALGGLFFELITGELPFPGRTPQQMIMMHQEQIVPALAPRDGAEHWPEGLDAFIRKCMAKDPAERYPSAKEALRLFEALTRGWSAPDRRDLLEPFHRAELEELKASSGAANQDNPPAGDGGVLEALSSRDHVTTRGRLFEQEGALTGEGAGSEPRRAPASPSAAARSRRRGYESIGLLAMLLFVILTSAALVYWLYTNL